MDIKTALEVMKSLPPHISILLRGDHGIGKSEVVAQYANYLGARLLDRRMSQCSEGDTIGLPQHTTVKGPDGKTYDITRFCPPEFIAAAKMEKSVLFLDELNRSTPEVMQACFQYALDRCDFQGDKFHPETRVVAAVNTGGNYQVNEMDPALLDRFFVIDLTPSAEDFFVHAESRPDHLGGPINRALIAFLKSRETRLDPAKANPGTVQPSRRSWVRLDSVYKLNGVYDQDLGEDPSAKGRAYSLATGLVGIEAATDLVDYLATLETRFKAENVLNEYGKHRAKIKKLGQDKLNALIDLIQEDSKHNVWTPDQSKNLGDFVGDIPAELRVGFVTGLAKALKSNPNFTDNFKAIHSTVMPHIVKAYQNGEIDPNKKDDSSGSSDDTSSTTSKKTTSKKTKK